MANKPNNVTWLADIYLALQEFGGKSTLKQLYRWIESRRVDLPANFQSVVRACLQRHCSGSAQFDERNPDAFYSLGDGVWGLRDPKEFISGRSKSAITLCVISEFTPSDWNSIAGNVAKADTLIAERILAKKNRFKMG